MLQRLLWNVSDAERRGTEVWLFGSACDSDTPRDIDILIVYDTDVLSVSEAIAFRARLADQMAAVAGIPAHIVMLNRNELDQTRFLKFIHAIKILRRSQAGTTIADANHDRGTGSEPEAACAIGSAESNRIASLGNEHYHRH